MVPGEHARLALAEGHGLVIAALRLAQDEEDEAEDDNRRQQDAEKTQPAAEITGLLIDHVNLAQGQR